MGLLNLCPFFEYLSIIIFWSFALQHRGQESAGIAISKGCGINVQKGMGLVAEVFKEEDIDKLEGHIGIGHVRYSSTGSTHIIDAQPMVCRYLQGNVALAHNGNLTNAHALRKALLIMARCSNPL